MYKHGHLHRWSPMHLNPGTEICVAYDTLIKTRCIKTRPAKHGEIYGYLPIGKRFKYRNRPSNIPLKGVYFKSQAERNHALWLESEKRAGRIAHWQYEMNYDLRANGKLIGKHKPDFTVSFPNGIIEVHEVKGGLATQTAAWRLRKKLFEANFPYIKYKVFDGRKKW